MKINMQDFKSQFKKIYPVTTKARKFWVAVVGVAIPIIVLTIIANLAHSKDKQRQENQHQSKIDQLATTEDTNWYNNTTPPVSDLPNKPLTPKEKTQLQNLKNMMLGKGAGFGGNDIGGNGDHQNNENDENDEIEKAMRAAITTNQITSGNQNNALSDMSSQVANPESVSRLNSSGPDSQNMQKEKQDFLIQAQKNNPDYLGAALQNPLSPYELQAGSIIPAVLITGINSDLPGQITAQVTENVYDSTSGNNLLIPQGTKVVGVYDSKIAYGQERVLVAWKRLIFPNGQSMDLEGMPGVDISGYAGFNDEVDNHYARIFGSVILMSFLSAGAQLSQPQNGNNSFNAQPTVNQMLAQSLGTNLANTANSITQKNINIQPTLEIRPGYQFNISVTKDMVFRCD